MKSKFSFCLAMMILGVVALAQGTGSISGLVVDKEAGEPMIGAYVRIDGTDKVAFVDISGQYTFKGLAVGTYTVVGAMDGFTDFKVENVKVEAGKDTTVNMQLGVDGMQESITVSAELLENSEISLLKHRQKSSSISDAIAAEEISRSGGGNAADAVSRVTGASVVGGKYVFIRGLGDRYTSTHLNGVELPTADPDTKAFQADLFPSNILDNIVTVKSFTPDKPGNFSGGIVDIGTKAYPRELTYSLSLSSSMQTNITGDEALYYPGSGSDWRGMDDGLRALPEIFGNGETGVPLESQARFDDDKAALLDEMSRSFNNVMAPLEKKAPFNQGYSFSIGNNIPVLGREFGFLASLTYSRKFKGYDDRQISRWKLTENADVADALVNQSDFIAAEGKDSVNWGTLATLSYTITDNNEIGFNAIYTQSGESTAHSYGGSWPDQFASNAVLESRLLKYSERNLTSFQLNGEHYVTPADLTIKWNVSRAKTAMDEPDTRIFTNHKTDRVIQGEPVTIYSIAPSNYNNPARYWRDLEEESTNFNVNANLKVDLWNAMKGTIKFGISGEEKDRNFNELRYEYDFKGGVRYDGTTDSIFGEDVTGIIDYDEATGRYTFGTVIELAPDARGGNYVGTSDLLAYYGMIEIPFTSSFKMITGARFEDMDFRTNRGTEIIDVITQDGEEESGALDDQDVLPSLNFIYEIGGKTNIRASYGRTLARPNFREKADYASYDFIADGIFVGNPLLKRTLIDNIDLRWERFPRSGELIAASVFYKEFENPIERAYNIRTTSEFGEKTFLNVDEATVYGLELEIRKRFDALVASGESNHVFSIGGNVSFIESEVDIPEEEYEFILQRDPNASPTRQLQGQSPYIVNASVHYDNVASGTAASIFYNVFGERLDEVGVGGAPDALEQARHMLDFTLSQPLFKGLKFKFVTKNLLDDPIEITQEFKGQSFIRSLYKTGTSYSLSLSYKP